MMGHLNSGRGEFEQKFSKNSNARGGCLSFDLTDTLCRDIEENPGPGARRHFMN